MKWQNKLKKNELKHLREMGITTLHQFQKTINKQQKIRNKDGKDGIEPCWDCRLIMQKLDMVPQV